jgi:nucleotide-binding universal stress UspA family protein
MPKARNPKSKKPDSGLRRILVASDLTAYSDRAFDRAVMLAGDNGAAVHFLHAVDPNLLSVSYLRRDIREAQALLEHEVRDSGIDNRIDVSINVATGDADKLVVEEARVMQADLIVMGLSHDATLTGMVRGTTIDKVVRRARCPVLCRQDAREAFLHEDHSGC